MTTQMTESDALRTYAASQSPDAFAYLVELHADWVYAAATRMVRDRQRAEDVAQAVFLLLARHPGKAAGKPLAGWLFQVTRHCAAHALRAEARRAAHERRAAMRTGETPGDEDRLWSELSPRLDEAVSRLGEADRRLILMRFYENRSLGQIGASLNISDDAARKRVGTAVDRLRALLTVSGIPVAAVAALLSARTAPAAPPVLKAKLCAGATAPSAAAITLSQGASTMMFLTQVKSVAAVAVATLVVAVAGWQVVRHARAADVQAPATAAASAPSPRAVALIPQAQPFHAFLEAIKAGDADKFRDCQWKEIRESNQPWAKKLAEAKRSLNARFGDYDIARFTYLFSGDESQGNLAIYYPGQRAITLKVVKEGAEWKLASD
jgi:RNA polymerase sigma factor (sigma-70 family)